MKWAVAAALCMLPLFLLPAQKKQPTAPVWESSASAYFDSRMTWKNSSASATDWTASGSTPRFSAGGINDFRIRFPGAPWLVLGGTVRSEARAALDSRSPAGKNPYMVVERADISAAAGLVAGLAPSLGGVSLLFDISMEGGARVHDLNSADAAYTPLATEGDAFWFRFYPLAASTQHLEIAAGKTFDLSLENRMEVWWDAEDAYGRAYAHGFTDRADIAMGFLLGGSGSSSWRAGVEGSAEMDSGLITPEVNIDSAITTSLKVDKVIRLKLGMLTCHWRADMPALDYSRLAATEFLLGSSVALKSYLDKGAWTVEAAIPWKAITGPSEWKLSLGMEYTN